MMENIILIIVLLLILGGATWYIIRAKKSGKKCIGCPDGGCSKTGNACCHCQEKK